MNLPSSALGYTIQSLLIPSLEYFPNFSGQYVPMVNCSCSGAFFFLYPDKISLKQLLPTASHPDTVDFCVWSTSSSTASSGTEDDD